MNEKKHQKNYVPEQSDVFSARANDFYEVTGGQSS